MQCSMAECVLISCSPVCYWELQWQGSIIENCSDKLWEHCWLINIVDNTVHGVQYNIVDNIVHRVQHNIADNIVHGVQHNIVDKIVHGVQHNINCWQYCSRGAAQHCWQYCSRGAAQHCWQPWTSWASDKRNLYKSNRPRKITVEKIS